jgi:hypothetical protein
MTDANNFTIWDRVVVSMMALGGYFMCFVGCCGIYHYFGGDVAPSGDPYATGLTGLFVIFIALFGLFFGIRCTVNAIAGRVV